MTSKIKNQSIEIMKIETKFVMCVENKNYLSSLEFGKTYRIVLDEKSQKHQMIRAIDESGEDYLYSEKAFVAIELPQIEEDAFMALS